MRARLHLGLPMENGVARQVIEPIRVVLRDRFYESLIGDELARRLPGVERRRTHRLPNYRPRVSWYAPHPVAPPAFTDGVPARSIAPSTESAGSAKPALTELTPLEVARHMLLGGEDPFWAQVWAEMEAQSGPMVDPSGPAPFHEPASGRWIHDALRAFVTKRAERIVDAVIERTLPGVGSTSRFALFEAEEELLGVDLAARVAKLARVTSLVGWWWPFRTGALLCERPIRLERNTEGRLHGATGPAVAYSDGFAVHAWHGVIVPREVIEDPLTRDQILAEPNAEVRRVMLERYGLLRFVSEGGAHRIHEDRFGQLYRIDSDDAEPIVLVRVSNRTPEPDGTFREYVLRVPPDVRTAHEAVAWTFGESATDYRPAVET